MKTISILLIFSLVLSSCSPLFRYKDKDELSRKLNFQASKDKLELFLKNGSHYKLIRVELLEDSLYYQLIHSTRLHAVAYEEIKHLQFKNDEKSMFWGTTVGLSLAVLQWNILASGYESGEEKDEVAIMMTIMYMCFGAIIGWLIGINEKVSPASIQSIIDEEELKTPN